MIWEVSFTPRGLTPSLTSNINLINREHADGKNKVHTIPAKPVHNFPPPPSIPVNYEALYGRFSASKLGGRHPQSNPTWFMYLLRLRKKTICGVCLSVFMAKLSFQASSDRYSNTRTPCAFWRPTMQECERGEYFLRLLYWLIIVIPHCADPASV